MSVLMEEIVIAHDPTAVVITNPFYFQEIELFQRGQVSRAASCPKLDQRRLEKFCIGFCRDKHNSYYVGAH